MTKPRIITFKSMRAQLRINAILNVLKNGPMPTVEIAKAIYCGRGMVSQYLAHLMQETTPRQVRIEDYEIVNGNKRNLYGLGSMPDAPMETKTTSQRWKELKLDANRHETLLAQKRKMKRQKRAQVPESMRKRDRRVYEPALEVQVLELVGYMPGYTTQQIADKLDANIYSTELAVRNLRKDGEIERARNVKGHVYRWQTKTKPMPKPVTKMKPQGIFAALGI